MLSKGVKQWNHWSQITCSTGTWEIFVGAAKALQSCTLLYQHAKSQKLFFTLFLSFSLYISCSLTSLSLHSLFSFTVSPSHSLSLTHAHAHTPRSVGIPALCQISKKNRCNSSPEIPWKIQTFTVHRCRCSAVMGSWAEKCDLAVRSCDSVYRMLNLRVCQWLAG